MNVYLMWNKNEEELKESTSGGVAFLLARMFFEKGDYVCGCVYTESFEGVKHVLTNNLNEIEKMRGSKYVRSYLGKDLFCDIADRLKTNRVLFIGCPCQIWALKFFLKRKNTSLDNLRTCSLICRGVTNPDIFKKYILELKEKHQSEISKITLRDTQNGWGNKTERTKIVFENGDILCECFSKNEFIRLFCSDHYLNGCCYHCGFKKYEFWQGDLIIGDAWGVDRFYPKDMSLFGNSLVLSLTTCGEDMLNDLLPFVFKREVDLNLMKMANPCLLQSVKRR